MLFKCSFNYSTLLGVCINLHVQFLGAAGSKANLGRIQNINGRLIPTAEVTSLIEQTTKARITEIYLFFLNDWLFRTKLQV